MILLVFVHETSISRLSIPGEGFLLCCSWRVFFFSISFPAERVYMVSLAVLLSHWGFVIRDFGPTFAVWAPRLWIHLPEETESRRSSNFFTIIIVISFHLVIPFCSQPVYNSSCDVLILPSFTAFICLFILIYLSDFTRFTALTSSDVMSSSCCSLLMLFMSLFAFLSVCFIAVHPFTCVCSYWHYVFTFSVVFLF